MAVLAAVAKLEQPMREFTEAEARKRLDEVVDLAQREPVVLTRRGPPVAYVVASLDAADPELVARQRAGAAHWYAEYCRSIADEAAHGPAAQLTDAEVNELVHELRSSGLAPA